MMWMGRKPRKFVTQSHLLIRKLPLPELKRRLTELKAIPRRSHDLLACRSAIAASNCSCETPKPASISALAFVIRSR